MPRSLPSLEHRLLAGPEDDVHRERRILDREVDAEVAAAALRRGRARSRAIRRASGCGTAREPLEPGGVADEPGVLPERPPELRRHLAASGSGSRER